MESYLRNGARPSRKSRRDPEPTRYSSDKGEYKQNRLHKHIAEFEDYQTILASIRKDLKAGLTTKELQAKYAPLAQARVISEMLTNEDGSKALSAAKDLLDRVEGRATEKKEVTHRFKDMSDKELDAVLKSEEEDLKDMEQRFEQ